MLHVPVMVSVDKRGVHDVLLPGVSRRIFSGVSLAELLDDVALHLMEVVPGADPATLPALRLCPDIELRRVKTTARIGGTARKPVMWSGRLSVVVTRWKDDGFFVCRVPRMGTKAFAVQRTADLEMALSRFVAAWAEAIDGEVEPDDLQRFECRGYEYIEVLEVDTELPTVLPSRPPPRKKKKRDKTRGPKARRKPGEKRERPKRRLVPPRTLRQVGVDLTHKAIDGRLGRTFGRDALVEQVMAQLDRPGAAILLVGPSGVGKTAIVNEVVRRLAGRGEALHVRSDVWSVDGNRIIAGMSVVGAWEQRCKSMVAELEARQDVLFVDDLPGLVYTGRTRTAGTNVAQYLEPHIARGDIRIIGECTAERLEATREEAPGFFSRFHIVQVPELDERQTLMVLVDTLRAVEAREAVSIHPEVLETILALTRRFMRRQCHPGKAVALLERLVGDYGKVERDDRGRRIIGREALIDFFARRTGLPRFVLWEQQSRPHSEVHDHFTRRIIGQPAASDAAAAIVSVLQQGLDDPERPLATMLFVGPTGVGKTETAKALAEYLFGHAERLIRFDMSEFRDPWSMARLFGDRNQPEGELTRAVSQQPFSVVLFDEIEKAHPRVFDAFLQVFGEGRLTNAAGRTTDFCNAILIMTSNLGVRDAQRSLGFASVDGAREASHYRKAAEGFFRPEFFNRIDRIVPFRSLAREDLPPLVKRTLAGILGRRGLRRSGVMVEVEPELVELLVDRGFDPRFGARSMRRALEQQLTVPLARRIVSQPVDRTTLVQLYREGDQIGMSLWALEDVPAGGSPPRVLDGWPAVREAFAELRADFESLLTPRELAHYETERGALLARFNAAREVGAALPERAWARLNLLNGLLDPQAGSRFGGPPSVADIRWSLDAIHERFLARYDFVEVVEAAHMSYDRWGAPNPTGMVGVDMPLERDSVATFGPAVEALTRVERELADVAFRVDALSDAEPQSALLRVLPGTDEPASREWAYGVMREIGAALASRADIRDFERVDGVWIEAPAAGADERRTTDGFAMQVTGFGVGRLVDGELGFHLSLRYSGADLICALARVERLPLAGQPGERSPEQALNADEVAYTRWRTARRAGELDADDAGPRPKLPLRRRWDSGGAVDPETGVRLDPGAGLKAVFARRMLNAHRRRRAGDGIGMTPGGIPDGMLDGISDNSSDDSSDASSDDSPNDIARDPTVPEEEG